MQNNKNSNTAEYGVQRTEYRESTAEMQMRCCTGSSRLFPL